MKARHALFRFLDQHDIEDKKKGHHLMANHVENGPVFAPSLTGK